MKKNKNKSIKIIITIGVIVIISLIIIILILNIIKERKELNKNMEVIKYNYNELSTNVNEYNQIRTELLEKLNNFTYETYSNIHEEYIELLTKYNANIKKIDLNITNIDSRCNVIYNDKEINNICNGYKDTYEKLVNLYVNDLTNYNNKLTSYNEYKETDNNLFELVHKDYIDYNEDKIYEGKDVENEENKEEE